MKRDIPPAIALDCAMLSGMGLSAAETAFALHLAGSRPMASLDELAKAVRREVGCVKGFMQRRGLFARRRRSLSVAYSSRRGRKAVAAASQAPSDLP